MFSKAAHVLSEHAPILRDPFGSLFPAFEHLRDISKKIAHAVVQVAQDEGLSPKTSPQEIEKMVARTMWTPDYP